MNAKVIEILKDFKALTPSAQKDQLVYYAGCIDSVYQAKSKEEAGERNAKSRKPPPPKPPPTRKTRLGI